MPEVVKKQLTLEELDKKKRSIFFKPCLTKSALSKWIRLFLDLEMPDCIVDPDSNSSPMDMIFETYIKALKNNDPNFSRVLYYASRDSYKKLGAAVLEVLSGLHLKRDVGHMAAIDSQAQRGEFYVKNFFSKPILRDFKASDNLREIYVVRYYNKKTEENLTEKEFKALPRTEQDQYECIKNNIKIIICTIQGVNSFHAPIVINDEIDVVADLRAYEDSKMIPAPMNGLIPITLLTSTRKVSFGLVQKEIDNAVDKNGNVKLHIRHWNLIDVTEKCPASRCLPELPKIPIYSNDDTLEAISEKQYESLNEDEQAKFVKHEGFQGCLSNCRIFSPCKTRLYTIQKSTSKLLRPINHTINQFQNVTLQNAQSQLLCKKPSTEGLIYTALDRTVHMKTAAQMAEMLLGHPVKADFTKKELIALIKKREDWGFYAGMDFGFSHSFAVVTGAADGYRCFILDAFSEPNLLPDGQVNICNKRIKHLNPQIFADPENPQMVAVLKQAGFRMKKWIKGPGSLGGGMDAVKLKLREPLGQPTLFFLAGDAGVEQLFKHMSGYHWKLTASGEISDVPSEQYKDSNDAVRYLVMNKFSASRGGAIRASTQNDKEFEQPVDNSLWTKSNFYQKVIEKHVGEFNSGTDNSGAEGGIKWSF